MKKDKHAKTRQLRKRGNKKWINNNTTMGQQKGQTTKTNKRDNKRWQTKCKQDDKQWQNKGTTNYKKKNKKTANQTQTMIQHDKT